MAARPTARRLDCGGAQFRGTRQLCRGCYPENHRVISDEGKTEQNPSLARISEYYGPQRDQPIIPRSQYVEIKPTENYDWPEKPNQVLCESAATGMSERHQLPSLIIDSPWVLRTRTSVICE
jgi:hypothetical protein